MTESSESNEPIRNATSTTDVSQVVEGLRQFGFSLSKSVKPFRWVGYGLLILTVLSWLTLLIPLQLTSAVWGFQSAGQFIEGVPMLLIALVLIFYAELSLRASWERAVLKVLSWLCLVLAIVYFLMTLVLGINGFRLLQQSEAQVDAEFRQQMSQAAQIEQQINLASPEEVVGFIQSQGGQVEGSPEEAKADLLAQLGEARSNLETQRAVAIGGQQLTIVKNGVKWFIGTILAGVLLLYLWSATRWTRGKS
jgi:hypothetical protein